jgi:hypothetical protein
VEGVCESRPLFLNQSMPKSGTKVLSNPQSTANKKSKLSNAVELEAWREYFTVERRAQVQDRFSFLTQSFNLDDADEISAAFCKIYEKCIPTKSKPTSRTNAIHKPPRVEPEPEVILSQIATERQFQKMKRLVERIKPRRPPFLVRTFQVESEQENVE